jgi:anti-anti-sigma factor
MVDYEVLDKENSHAFLRLRGRLIGDVSSHELKRALERHYVDDGVKRIRVDLSDLSEISLEGVAILLDLWRESTRRRKEFVIEGARGQVREKLEVTGALKPLAGQGP